MNQHRWTIVDYFIRSRLLDFDAGEWKEDIDYERCRLISALLLSYRDLGCSISHMEIDWYRLIEEFPGEDNLCPIGLEQLRQKIRDSFRSASFIS